LRWRRDSCGSRRRCGTARAGLDKFDVVAGEQALLASAVLTHPPILVDHVDVEDTLAFTKLKLILLRFLIVVLGDSFVTSTVVSAGARILGGAERSGCCSLASTACWVFLLDLRLRLGDVSLCDCLGNGLGGHRRRRGA
jgi:hypothetical protein